MTLLAGILASAINIIPQPLSVSEGKGSLDILKETRICCAPGMGDKAVAAATKFSEELGAVTGKTFTVVSTPVEGNAGRGLVFVPEPTLAEEAYTISIDKHRAMIKASSDAGFLHAIQSVKQLLPVSIYGDKGDSGAKWTLPCCEIKDKPRFGHRGMMLDCCRHFWSVDEVKKVLDVMAMLKINRFHWHLTDDQGWRAEIKAYPRLTEVGAWRDRTIIGYMPPQKKSEYRYDETRYGGFYTQDEMRDIVAYADRLGITVIPEVDLPGHMVAALASYPWLGCSGKSIETGGEYKVWPLWGISPDVLCPGKESTFEFLQAVIGELCDIFPGRYFHVGGDECPKTAWEQCPDCQARIAALGLKSDGHASAEQRLQNYVTSRMQEFLATRGKKLIGWDEILEGELTPGATVMSWRGTEGGIEASRRGFDAIMSPNRYCYFDYNQCGTRNNTSIPVWEDVDEPMCAWWGTLPIEKVYSLDPTEGLDETAASHILGVQANVWTEYIPTEEQLEYMIMPRLFAMSEVQWCFPEGKDFDKLMSKVKGWGFRMLDTKGFNYRNK